MLFKFRSVEVYQNAGHEMTHQGPLLMAHVGTLQGHRNTVRHQQRCSLSIFARITAEKGNRITPSSATGCSESSANSFSARSNGPMSVCPQLISSVNYSHTRQYPGHKDRVTSCKMTSDSEYNGRWLKIWSDGLPAGQVDSELRSFCKPLERYV